MDFLYTEDEIQKKKRCTKCIPNPIRYIRKRINRRRKKKEKHPMPAQANFGLIRIPPIPSIE
jgi:hypothetical protein